MQRFVIVGDDISRRGLVLVFAGNSRRRGGFFDVAKTRRRFLQADLTGTKCAIFAVQLAPAKHPVRSACLLAFAPERIRPQRPGFDCGVQRLNRSLRTPAGEGYSGTIFCQPRMVPCPVRELHRN